MRIFNSGGFLMGILNGSAATWDGRIRRSLAGVFLLGLLAIGLAMAPTPAASAQDPGRVSRRPTSGWSHILIQNTTQRAIYVDIPYLGIYGWLDANEAGYANFNQSGSWNFYNVRVNYGNQRNSVNVRVYRGQTSTLKVSTYRGALQLNYTY